LTGATSRCEENRARNRRHALESLGQSSPIHRKPR
jgi:hypothetical protein